MIDLPFIFAGAMTGFMIGLTGVGGGALMTPILLLVFGISPMTAIATDLWFAAITKSVGVMIHHQSKQVDWLVARRVLSGSLPAAVIIMLWIHLAGQHLEKMSWLSHGIGFIVVVTSIGLLLSPILFKIAKARRLEQPQQFKVLQPVATVMAGIFLGICVSLTSIGAGALGSVLLLYLYPLRMTPHKLVATDIASAIPLAVVAGLGYLWAGLVEWKLLFNLLFGSLPAIILGSLLAQYMNGRWIQILLALVLLGTGAKILFI